MNDGVPTHGNVVPILMYHNIAKAPRQLSVYRSLYVSPGAFARQLRLLKMLGYRGVSMTEAMPYLRGEQHGKVVALTLDDGYVDNLEAALPVLQQLGFSATCYVVSGRLARFNDWDHARLGIRKPLMSAVQLRQWHQAGMEVGAHTRSHPRLPHCDDAALEEEIAGSKAELEQSIGAPVTQFCYPYGVADERVARATQAAGFCAATTTRRGRARAGANRWMLPRVQIARHHLLPQFAMRVLTGYEDRRG